MMNQDERRIVPAGEAFYEIRVSNSRFIGYAAPAQTIDTARSYHQSIRSLHPSATHHVPAFLIGHGRSIVEHCSDDGEPSGTAGRPVLTVVKGSGLGDIAVVIVRYFGGTKLGTGGLVRAYTEAAQSVLAKLPLAEKVSTRDAILDCPYTFFERIQGLIEQLKGQILVQEFGAEVHIAARFRESAAEGFVTAVREVSNGRLEVMLLEKNPGSILPLAGNAE